MTEQRIFSRLEDFMSIAKKGEKVDLTVVLNTRSVRAKFPFYTRKFDPSTIGDPEEEIDMFILSADYLFVVAGETKEITKYYASGIEGESPIVKKRNIYVANERLKMDYERLKEAKIVFLEKFWD